MKKLILLLSLITIFFSCQEHRKHKRQPKSVKVKCYKTHGNTSDNDLTNDWLFWYVIMNNNGGCNYCSSYVPISNYSSVSWVKSPSVPNELNDKENVQEQPEQEVEVDNLSADMQNEIDTTPENYEGMTYEELGDYENSTQDIDNTDSNSDNSSSESSDSGSGDSGGGDSGGGDGGGGGD